MLFRVIKKQFVFRQGLILLFPSQLYYSFVPIRQYL